MNNISEFLSSLRTSFVFNSSGGYETQEGIAVTLILQITCQFGYGLTKYINQTFLQLPNGQLVESCDDTDHLNKTYMDRLFGVYAAGGCERRDEPFKVVHLYGTMNRRLDRYETLQGSKCIFVSDGSTKSQQAQFAVNYLNSDLPNKSLFKTERPEFRPESALMKSYLGNFSRSEPTTADFILKEHELVQSDRKLRRPLIFNISNVVSKSCACRCTQGNHPVAIKMLGLSLTYNSKQNTDLLWCLENGTVGNYLLLPSYTVQPSCPPNPKDSPAANRTQKFVVEATTRIEYLLMVHPRTQCHATPFNMLDSDCYCETPQTTVKIIKDNTGLPFIVRGHTQFYYQCYVPLREAECSIQIGASDSVWSGEEWRKDVCVSRGTCFSIIDILPNEAPLTWESYPTCILSCRNGVSNTTRKSTLSVSNGLPRESALKIEVDYSSSVKVKCVAPSPLHMHRLVITLGKANEKSATVSPSSYIRNKMKFEVTVNVTQLREEDILLVRCVLLTAGRLITQSALVSVENPKIRLLQMSTEERQFATVNRYTCRFCSVSPVTVSWWRVTTYQERHETIQGHDLWENNICRQSYCELNRSLALSSRAIFCRVVSKYDGSEATASNLNPALPSDSGMFIAPYLYALACVVFCFASLLCYRKLERRLSRGKAHRVSPSLSSYQRWSLRKSDDSRQAVGSTGAVGMPSKDIVEALKNETEGASFIKASRYLRSLPEHQRRYLINAVIAQREYDISQKYTPVPMPAIADNPADQPTFELPITQSQLDDALAHNEARETSSYSVVLNINQRSVKDIAREMSNCAADVVSPSSCGSKSTIDT